MTTTDPTTANVEIIKLARELDLPIERLQFLAHLPHPHLAELRHHLTNAMFSRQEPRFRRMASAAKVIPNGLVAKAAQFTIGPKISAWMASALPAEQAVKVANSLELKFLTQVSRWLDPQRSIAIVKALPDRTTIAVGRGLVDLEEWVPLGRYLVVVSANVVVGVMEHMTDEQLIEVARFVEAPHGLDAGQRATLKDVLTRLGDERGDLWLTSIPQALADLVAG